MTTEFTMILFVLVGLIIGFVAGRSTSRAGDAAKLHKELTKTRKEFEQYKRDVQDHFIGEIEHVCDGVLVVESITPAIEVAKVGMLLAGGGCHGDLRLGFESALGKE